MAAQEVKKLQESFNKLPPDKRAAASHAISEAVIRARDLRKKDDLAAGEAALEALHAREEKSGPYTGLFGQQRPTDFNFLGEREKKRELHRQRRPGSSRKMKVMPFCSQAGGKKKRQTIRRKKSKRRKGKRRYGNQFKTKRKGQQKRIKNSGKKSLHTRRNRLIRRNIGRSLKGGNFILNRNFLSYLLEQNPSNITPDDFDALYDTILSTPPNDLKQSFINKLNIIDIAQGNSKSPFSLFRQYQDFLKETDARGKTAKTTADDRALHDFYRRPTDLSLRLIEHLRDKNLAKRGADDEEAREETTQEAETRLMRERKNLRDAARKKTMQEAEIRLRSTVDPRDPLSDSSHKVCEPLSNSLPRMPPRPPAETPKHRSGIRSQRRVTFAPQPEKHGSTQKHVRIAPLPAAPSSDKLHGAPSPPEERFPFKSPQFKVTGFEIK